MALTNHSGELMPNEISGQLLYQLSEKLFTRDSGKGIIRGIILRLYTTSVKTLKVLYSNEEVYMIIKEKFQSSSSTTIRRRRR
jgi:hypothetical protein